MDLILSTFIYLLEIYRLNELYEADLQAIVDY